MKTSLIHTLYQIGAIQFGEFTLKSGQTSSIYMNLRKIISYPALLKTIAGLMRDITAHASYNLVCGVPYTALPIATCISLDYDIPMIMRRKEKKTYGTKQMIEGEFTPGQKCLVIEDVITSGGSLLETADELVHAGLVVNDVVALIDREQGGRAALEKRFTVHTVLTLTEILNTLLNDHLLSEQEAVIVNAFLAERQDQ